MIRDLILPETCFDGFLGRGPAPGPKFWSGPRQTHSMSAIGAILRQAGAALERMGTGLQAQYAVVETCMF